jgi:hypothetical protein
MEKKYLIESMEHSFPPQIKSWWKPDGWGYTTCIEQAGRYEKEEAEKICKNAGPENERMWLEEDVLAGKAGRIQTVVMN